MQSIPDNVSAYKKTPLFTEDTVPQGLLNDHNTKAGVWGKIVVTSGELRYTINQPHEVVMLSEGVNGVVEPEVLHSVKPIGQMSFYVEFYR